MAQRLNDHMNSVGSTRLMTEDLDVVRAEVEKGVKLEIEERKKTLKQATEYVQERIRQINAQGVGNYTLTERS